ncbi:unnamed protein product [Candida verbasci]|uniref:Transcriptional coactivator p15 (PC4) C-terminal domain-containing protein n=1 Tax=Candida verbasci TaxID=1227364 RepID=A0A9W4XMR5_9ASCO|nr:unnamed protein product [Candida verbasci]
MGYKRSFKNSDNGPTITETEIELDGKKRVTVRKFNGINLIDIREFYLSKDGEKLPGTKGISLTEDAYYKLLDSTNKIQDALDKLNGGVSKKKQKTEEGGKATKKETKKVEKKKEKDDEEKEEEEEEVADDEEEDDGEDYAAEENEDEEDAEEESDADEE